MKKINEYFWTKSNYNVNHSYYYPGLFNYFYFLPKRSILSVRNFYKL